MILDYSESINLETSFNTSEGGNTDLYFSQRGFCLNCNLNIRASASNALVDTSSVSNFAWHRVEQAWECPSCGWWEYKYSSELESIIDASETKFGEARIRSAILKKFEIDSNVAPIAALESLISREPERIHQIHHGQMEKLVASVFSDHYTCEARIIGGSNDGGIDIVLITAEHPILVQVKRRKSSKKRESVAQIRELIGATLLTEAKNCIFVTTADQFTKSAVATRDTALTKGLVNSFELFDRHQFIECLNLKKSSDRPIYSQYLQLS
jgi:hypothetical protein